MSHILLVEDAEDCQILVRETLARVATVKIAASIRDARIALDSESFDLIVLDLSLPDGDGLELFGDLRKQADLVGIPVFFLSARTEAAIQVAAFALGADDYILKPLRPIEFRARVEAKLKKSLLNQHREVSLVRGQLRIELGVQRAFAFSGGERLDLGLTSREFKLLYHLARNEGCIFSREQLITEVWGDGVHVQNRTIDTHIYTLRKKLGAYALYIESEVGTGYRFNCGKKLKRAAA